MDKVRSMISNASLLKFLWMYALKTITYLLNKVPSKAIQKTLFELRIGRKPSLSHLRVWGCPMKVRIYNPQELKGTYFIVQTIIQKLWKLVMQNS